MELEEIIIDSTVIKFFDDYITADEKEILEKALDLAVTKAFQEFIKIEGL